MIEITRLIADTTILIYVNLIVHIIFKVTVCCYITERYKNQIEFRALRSARRTAVHVIHLD